MPAFAHQLSIAAFLAPVWHPPSLARILKLLTGLHPVLSFHMIHGPLWHAYRSCAYCVCKRVRGGGDGGDLHDKAEGADDGEEAEADEEMVGCDDCDNWFHFTCLGLDARDVDTMGEYRCVYCFHAGIDSAPSCESVMTWAREVRQERQAKRRTLAAGESVSHPSQAPQ